MNGYSDKLVAIDEQIAALGRPPPPVVSWLSSGLKGDIIARHEQWRQRVEAWEEANPESAVRWLELRQEYIAQERLELKARYNEQAWSFEQLRFIGCPELVVSSVMAPMRETASWRDAREWMLDFDSWCLVLIGRPGCGKSVAAGWAAHQKLMRNVGVQWVDCPKQCEKPMYGMEAEHRRFTCRNAKVLVIDDLGSGRREQASDPWAAWLDDVLGSRANDGLKTLITTNRTADELKAWLGERLVDRIRAGTIRSSGEKSMRGAA